MGAIDIKFWGSMTPRPDGSELMKTIPHEGVGAGSFRHTGQKVKEYIDEVVAALEERHKQDEIEGRK